MKGYIDGLDNPGLQQRYGDRLHSRVRLQQGRGQSRTTILTARSLCSRLLTIMAAVALVAVGAAPARADMCMGAKLKALGNKEAGLLTCQATNAAKPDTLKLAACESNAMGKFGPACSAAGACSGVCSTCESNADSCESNVSAAITDAATLKAASKLVKAELKCYTNAAKKSVPVDTVTCLAKAQGKFTGTPTQRNTVEMDCVDNQVTTDGGGSPPTGMVTAICSSGGPTTGDWGATLTSGDPVTGGYDFDTRTYTGPAPGDLYFSQGAFWANNLGQRGVVQVGACDSVDGVATVPMAGYTRFGVPAQVGNCYVALGHNEEHGDVVFRVDDLTSSTVTITFKIVDDCYGLTTGTYGQNVNCWLAQNPGVSQYVVWESRLALGSSSPVAWAQWSNAQRDDLRVNLVNYEGLLAGTVAQDPDPLDDPPVNQETLQDSDFPVLVLSANDAWRLYVKAVAMSLAVELTKAVPWSVTEYDAPSLSALFDSRNTLAYTWNGRPANLGVNTPQAEGYMAIANDYDPATHSTFTPYASYVTPAPPAVALQFVRAKALQGATRAATIANAIDWARRLKHYVSTPSGVPTAVFQRVWGYRGPAPVSATIATTIDTDFDASNPYHFTAGCHGTAGFLQSILRTLNIPVDNDTQNGHSVTRFMTDALYLSHGDDPYIGSDIYGVPASGLLLSDATYQAWFVNGPYAAESIGRGNPESMIQYLSGKLQFSYCSDPPNTDPSNSLVLHEFTLFPDVYPLSYLENLPADPSNPGLPASLWDRLAQKVAVQGGCAATLDAIGQQTNVQAAVLPLSERLDYNW